MFSKVDGAMFLFFIVISRNEIISMQTLKSVSVIRNDSGVVVGKTYPVHDFFTQGDDMGSSSLCYRYCHHHPKDWRCGAVEVNYRHTQLVLYDIYYYFNWCNVQYSLHDYDETIFLDFINPILHKYLPFYLYFEICILYFVQLIFSHKSIILFTSMMAYYK